MMDDEFRRGDNEVPRGKGEALKDFLLRPLKLLNNCPVPKAFGTGYVDKAK
ncbi:MAG: hypothetical protein HGB06_04765 [Chlorobaculum sp.]|jgi:hypothetical protein|nr:hypothetical protein [Chlorobaculum sp.]